MRRRLVALLLLLPFFMSGCAVREVDDWFNDIYLNVVLRRVIELMLFAVGQITRLLATTPIGAFRNDGFTYVYSHISAVALLAVVVMWAYVGVRMYWGATTAREVMPTVVRTALAFVLVGLVPSLFQLFAMVTNTFALTFAADYRHLDAAHLVGKEVDQTELGILLFAVILVYYLVRLLLQFAWRIGAMVMVHAFAPIFTVLWIVEPSVLPRVWRNLVSLFTVQVAQTIEMWVFTWVSLSMNNAEGVGTLVRLMLQIGMLQVMVSTPGQVLTNVEGWTHQPQASASRLWRELSLSPLRNQIARIGGRLTHGRP